MIINGKQYEDHIKTQLHYELAQGLRKAFIAQYDGQQLYFALSLASGRFDTCVKDIERGKVTLNHAIAILNNAVRHKVITQAYNDLILSRISKTDAKNT